MSEDILKQVDDAVLDPDARMDAYYYSFRHTGLAVIDRILSAVATAGKAYHHTEEWGEAGTWNDKPTHESRIQSAADESATLVRALVAELKAARELCVRTRDIAQIESGSLRSRVQELEDELETTRAQLRQVARQLGLFLEDGERNRVIVALAITDGTAEENDA